MHIKFLIFTWQLPKGGGFKPPKTAPPPPVDPPLGGGGGVKPDPVSNRSAHKKYTLSQYTLLKTFIIMLPCTGMDGLSILLYIIIHS